MDILYFFLICFLRKQDKYICYHFLCRAKHHSVYILVLLQVSLFRN